MVLIWSSFVRTFMLKFSKKTNAAGGINFVHSALFLSSVFYYHVYFVNMKKAPHREEESEGGRED